MSVISHPKEMLNFNGRATLREFALIWLLSIVMLGISRFVISNYVSLGFFDVAFFAAISVIALIRRLHDQDKTGLLALITFIPIMGWIFLIVLAVGQGTVGPNAYGEDPRGREEPIGRTY